MTTFHLPHLQTTPELHVFEQAGGWHWGITVPRLAGCGFKVVAFSEAIFPAADAARSDGLRALASVEVISALN